MNLLTPKHSWETVLVQIVEGLENGTLQLNPDQATPGDLDISESSEASLSDMFRQLEVMLAEHEARAAVLEAAIQAFESHANSPEHSRILAESRQAHREAEAALRAARFLRKKATQET